MKVQSSLSVVVLATVSSTSGFCPSRQLSRKQTTLHAENKWWNPVTTSVVGWTLASQVAIAVMTPLNVQMPTLQAESTSLLAAESTREKIDFSLPSYGSTSYGFGDGQEARLSEAKGGDENTKQMEAMKKAEAARQARLAEKKEAAKQREAEDRARAEEKKAKASSRFNEIFQ